VSFGTWGGGPPGRENITAGVESLSEARASIRIQWLGKAEQDGGKALRSTPRSLVPGTPCQRPASVGQSDRSFLAQLLLNIVTSSITAAKPPLPA